MIRSRKEAECHNMFTSLYTPKFHYFLTCVARKKLKYPHYQDVVQRTALYAWENGLFFDEEETFRRRCTVALKNYIKSCKRTLARESLRTAPEVALYDRIVEVRDARVRGKHPEDINLEVLDRKEVLLLYKRYWEDIPRAKIAEGMGLTRQSIDHQFQKILKKLRKDLVNS